MTEIPNTGSTRGEFLKRAAATGVLLAGGGEALSLGARASQASAATVPQNSKGSIVCNVQTGTLATAEIKVWLEPFTKATGIQVTPDERSLLRAQIIDMAKTGQGLVDVHTSIDNTWQTSEMVPYFEPIDYSIINRSAFPSTATNKIWVAVDQYSFVLGYNPAAWKGKKAPSTWADLFDLKNFPGKRNVESDPGVNFMMALLADGVPPNRMYPLDLKRAVAKLKPIKSQLLFSQSGSQSEAWLSSGESLLGMTFNGRVEDSDRHGAPIGVSWNHQFVDYDKGGVLKASHNIEGSMKLLALITGAKYGGALTEYFPYTSLNKHAHLDPVSKPWYAPTHFNQPYVLINRDKLNAQWNEIINAWNAFVS